MNFKKIILITLFVLILSVGFVSAADLDNTYVSESSGDIDDSFLVSSDVGDSKVKCFQRYFR